MTSPRPAEPAENSEESEGQQGESTEPSALRKNRDFVLQSLISSLVGAIGTYFIGFANNLGTPVVALVVLVVAVAGLLAGPSLFSALLKAVRRRDRDHVESPSQIRGSRGRHRFSSVTLWSAYLGALAGVAVVVTPLVAKPYIADLARYIASDCGSPQSLHVITASDNVRALNARAEEFVLETSVAGCPRYEVSVGPAPSMREMVKALGNRWRHDTTSASGVDQSYGPFPAAWIAGTTAEAELVNTKLRKSAADGPELTIGASVGEEKMVTAVLSGSTDRYISALPAADSSRLAPEQLGPLLDRGHVAYPHPLSSTVGLVALTDLRKLHSKWAVELGRFPGRDVDSVLCGFSSMPRSERNATVLLLPAHGVDDYNHRRFVGPSCERRVADYLVGLESPELTVLDYPFVDISWPSEQSDGTVGAAADFRSWLQERKLYSDPDIQLNTDAGTDPTPQHRLDEGLKAIDRIPPLSVHLALDVSGSMVDPPSALLFAFRRALSDMNMLFLPRDSFQVSGFAKGKPGGAGPRTLAAYGPGSLDNAVSQAMSSSKQGSDAPISVLIAGLGSTNSSHNVVVVTDGGPLDNEPDGIAGHDPAAGAQRIQAVLGGSSRVENLYILMVRGSCDAFLRQQEENLKCMEARNDVNAALERMVVQLREWQ